MNFQEFFSNNRWWGKLIGAFLGYLFAGPAGAFVGILIGNFIDRSLFEHFSQPYWRYHVENQEQIQQIFFEATFSVMGHIAKADGRVSPQEIAMAKTLMADMGLTPEQKIAAQNFFNQGKSTNFNLEKIIRELRENCSANPELLKLFMDIQYRSAQTDGFSEKKLQALDLIFRRLGFAPIRDQYRFYEDFGRHSSSQQQSSNSSRQRSGNYNGGYQNTQQSAQSTLQSAYALLELDRNANKQETKKAYRRLISRNHPDKLIAQGLPEAMIKIANEKTQKITKAYDVICEAKGWS
ncbi:MAG: co-chaperone DjlA [Tatlockia sp.]|nr:co-chaperone DjlA [Tatlockia sp.]